MATLFLPLRSCDRRFRSGRKAVGLRSEEPLLDFAYVGACFSATCFRL
jgi:hypothetical protein